MALDQNGHARDRPPEDPHAPLARWDQRILSVTIDSALLYVIHVLLAAASLATTTIPSDADVNLFVADVILGNALIFLVGAVYFVALTGSRRGQTLGRMIMKIQVRDEGTGGRVSYVKAGLRYLVGVVLFVLCIVPSVIDLLFPLWDRKRQTLHDKDANTLVIDLSSSHTE